MAPTGGNERFFGGRTSIRVVTGAVPVKRLYLLLFLIFPHQVEPRTLWRAFWFALLACAVGGALVPEQAPGVRLLMPVMVLFQAGIGFLMVFLGLRIGAKHRTDSFHKGFLRMCLFAFYMPLVGATLLILGPWLSIDPDHQVDLALGLSTVLGAAFGAYRVFDAERV